MLELREVYETRFQNFYKNRLSFNLFSSLFSVSIDEAPEHLQMECVDFHYASNLKN